MSPVRAWGESELALFLPSKTQLSEIQSVGEDA